GIFLGVAVVDAVDLGGFQNDFGANFVSAKGRGGVGGKIRVAGAATEDDDPALFEMADGAAADENFGDLSHGDGALDAGGDADFFEGILEGEGVDDGGKHAHVIAGGAFDAAFAAGLAAEDVAAADDHDDFDAHFADFGDLLGHVVDGLGTDAVAVLAAQGFTAEFEED